MTKEAIRDRTGNVIGYITEIGNRREVRDRSLGLLGWYDKKTGHTFGRDGNLAGYGDLTATFLSRAK